jgi:hypothetical protein
MFDVCSVLKLYYVTSSVELLRYFLLQLEIVNRCMAFNYCILQAVSGVIYDSHS